MKTVIAGESAKSNRRCFALAQDDNAFSPVPSLPCSLVSCSLLARAQRL